MMRRTVLIVALSLSAGSAPAAAPGYLFWRLNVPDAVSGENGLTFRLFGQGASVKLVLSFVNDESDTPIVVPASFISGLAITLRRGENSVPIAVDFVSVDLETQGGKASVPIGTPVVLEPTGRLHVGAVVRPLGSPSSFEEGLYRWGVNVEAAVMTLRLADGVTVWDGRYVGEGETLMHVHAQPTTTEDWLKFDTAAGYKALAAGNAMVALRHFTHARQVAPDLAGLRSSIGDVYLAMGRFQEAVAEFQAALEALGDEKSSLHQSLAYAHVALFDDKRAEVVLQRIMSAEQAQLRLRGIKDALTTRGWAPGSPLPIVGDTNADGKIDCADLAVIRVAYGRRFGQVGYDMRADITGDRLVDVRDLTLVTQRLTFGIVCR